MTKIKILENEMSGSVRTMTDERGEMTDERGEAFFVGKDVTKALGCSKKLPPKSEKLPPTPTKI